MVYGGPKYPVRSRLARGAHVAPPAALAGACSNPCCRGDPGSVGCWESATQQNKFLDALRLGGLLAIESFAQETSDCKQQQIEVWAMSSLATGVSTFATMKKPAAQHGQRSTGRTKGNSNHEALAAALMKWATKLNFISYTIDRCLSCIL